MWIQNNASPLGGYEGLRDTDVKHFSLLSSIKELHIMGGAPKKRLDI